MFLRRYPTIFAFFLLLGVACGAEPTPKPAIDFSDYLGQVMDDASREADLREVEAAFPDGTVVDQGGAEDARDLEGEFGALPVICKPGIASCKYGKVVVCDDGGTDYVVLDNCDDDNKCTVDDCVNAVCTHSPVTGSCCHPSCEIGHLCISNECVCMASCIGKECGDDGCGGSCGECEAGFSCSQGGKCKCQPNCEGLQCGDNGCGGQCGTCLPPSFCGEDGQCQCVPDCAGKICGDDGCGGICGDCPALHKCDDTGTVCSYSCAICPVVDGCSLAPYNGHVYYFCASGKKWDKARDKCKEFQAHLVTLGSAEENAFVAAQAAGGSYWIGYYQEWYTWSWRWVTDESKSFENWAQDQPDNGGFWPPDEDCTEIWGGGTWNDQECGADRAFICEFEPPQ